MRVLIACGGTGGHLFPGIALARAFLAGGDEVLMVGTAHGAEGRVLQREGLPFIPISARGFVGKGFLDRVRALLLVPIGLAQSISILRKVRPALAIGVGGYASLPVMIASSLLSIPRVVLEPNAVPGLTNRLVAPWVDLIIGAFEEIVWEFPRRLRRKIVVLGVPLREEIVRVGETPPITGVSTILVLGGSQGARALNRAMINALPHLTAKREEIAFIHQTGPTDLQETEQAYRARGVRARVEPFLEKVWEAYREAVLVIARSGAGTVWEIAACGRASILVPFPHAAEGHQEKNARALERVGAARVILESELTGERLAASIAALLSDPDRLAKMGEAARGIARPRATWETVQAVKRLVAA